MGGARIPRSGSAPAVSTGFVLVLLAGRWGLTVPPRDHREARFSTPPGCRRRNATLMRTSPVVSLASSIRGTGMSTPSAEAIARAKRARVADLTLLRASPRSCASPSRARRSSSPRSRLRWCSCGLVERKRLEDRAADFWAEHSIEHLVCSPGSVLLANIDGLNRIRTSGSPAPHSRHCPLIPASVLPVRLRDAGRRRLHG